MTFTGKAVYDSGVWSTLREDISDEISIISPFETPLLNALSQAEYPARSVLHEWMEESLNPNTIISSSDVGTAGTAIGVHASGAPLNFLQPGAQLKNKSTGEYLQVTAINGSTITVTRQFGSTAVSTIAAGAQLFVISDAALEGADIGVDGSRPGVRRNNYCQILRKQIVVSGTLMAVTHVGIDNEFEHQKQMRMKEILRDLEKAVIQGKLSGNTIGSATAYRTMRGLWDSIQTSITSTNTLTPTILDDAIESAWSYGANDLDLIVADSSAKQIIDSWTSNRVQMTNDDERYKQMVSFYQGSFGAMPVMVSRWMPTNSVMILSTERVRVLPLQGREFGFVEVPPTGDARKGMIIGEYTLEVRNEEGLAKLFF